MKLLLLFLSGHFEEKGGKEGAAGKRKFLPFLYNAVSQITAQELRNFGSDTHHSSRVTV